ncbi:MAG: 50S ribosomal protein L1 [Candidatus Levybacteria bacterium]|nr:50S ribosomal protein L1 [Candidatus Levybacteria bacterium]
MGKVRVKTFGLPEEEQEKKKLKQKKEAKKMAKAPGLKGGERVVSVGPSEEEILESAENVQEVSEETQEKKTKSKKEKFIKKRTRSQRYQQSAQVLDKTKTYSLNQALELLSKFQKTKFDETVELHVNTTQGGVSATIALPHGTGKKVRVAVADEKLITEIETGKINFDILVSTPAMMPKLAKVAKILGPRGLMPNPKNGTITDKPQDLIKKYEDGQINIRTEAKAPLIHLTVGKVSFGEKKLADNIESIISAIKKENITKVILKSTMSPGIKIKV